jgi:predicted homoserine dehydrogenase-like protein
LDAPVADVMTVAKRDLSSGEQLERFGGYTSYGLMDEASATRQQNALPVGLSPGARMRRSVKAGDVITWDDVDLDENSTVVKLRRQQDQALGQTG